MPRKVLTAREQVAIFKDADYESPMDTVPDQTHNAEARVAKDLFARAQQAGVGVADALVNYRPSVRGVNMRAAVALALKMEHAAAGANRVGPVSLQLMGTNDVDPQESAAGLAELDRVTAFSDLNDG